MEYSILGKTGRTVSRIGFGGATAGIKNYTGAFDPSDKSDRETLIRAIQRAYELGINYFDTASAYGDGASEILFGEGLKGIPEEKIFVATKASPMDGDGTRRSIEESLRRLNRDWIDLIQIHTPRDREVVFGEKGMLMAFEKAKEEGLVKHIGFTAEWQHTLLYEMIESERFDVMQVQYNLLFQHPSDRSFQTGSIHEAEKHNMGISVMRAATSGIFQRWIKTVNPENTFDYTPALIQLVLSNEMVDVALIGMRDAKTVEKNVSICEDLSGRIDLNEMHNRFGK